MRGRFIGTIAAWTAALLLCAGAAAPGAGALTFGADLSKAATNEYTCGMNVPPLGVYPGSSSCMYFSIAPTPYAPLSGTVTAVHVRVGPHTGPMQVVVLRSLYQNHAGDPGHPYFACCFVEAYGPVFEPQPNVVTTLPVNLPVTEEPTPPPEDFTTNAAGDFLALSVLAANVPIPIALDNSTPVSGYYPAPTAQTVPAPSFNPLFATTNMSAGQVMLSADLTPAGGAALPGPAPVPTQPGGGAAGLPLLKLARHVLPVTRNTVSVPVLCKVLDCRGNVALQNAPLGGLASAAAVKKTKRVTYGTTAFSLKAGATAKVKVKLSAKGRRLVKPHGSVKVWANITFSAGGGTPASVKVTLKR